MTTTRSLHQTDLAVPVANDVAAGALRASVHTFPRCRRSSPRRNGNAETMIFVEEGIIELSINGMDGYLSQGEFARVAPGAHFAFRNKNDVAGPRPQRPGGPHRAHAARDRRQRERSLMMRCRRADDPPRRLWLTPLT